MSKALLVARREYLYNLRRPAFLFGAFGVPLLLVVIMVVVFTMNISAASDSEVLGQIGYVDEAGVLSAEQDKPAVFTAYADEDAARADLENGALGAYFVVAADYLQTGDVRLYSQQTVPSAITREINNYLVANIGSRVADADLIERIKEPVTMTVRVLDSGRIITGAGVVGLFAMPIVFALVFYMSTQSTSGYLMSSVVEEKTNRIMEILITSVTPLELLLGKIIGLGLIGLTQLGVWIVTAVIALALGQNLEFLQGVYIPPDLIVITLVYFIFSYFLYAGIMAGIGATAGSEQESRQAAGVFGLVAVIPFFFFNLFLFNPDSPVVLALTLIPFTAPLAVIMRMSLSTVPAWQLIASLGILAVSTVLAVWVSARVFRWASLLYGKRATPREIWRVMRGTTSGQIGTVAATHEEQIA